MPIFLKVNHQLESRMPEIGQSGSEGGAKIAFVPTPIRTLWQIQDKVTGCILVVLGLKEA